MDKNRDEKLDNVLSQIEKQFGEGSLMRLGSEDIKPVSYTHLTLPTTPYV